MPPTCRAAIYYETPFTRRDAPSREPPMTRLRAAITSESDADAIYAERLFTTRYASAEPLPLMLSDAVIDAAADDAEAAERSDAPPPMSCEAAERRADTPMPPPAR